MSSSTFCINHNPEAKELKKMAVISGGKALKKIDQHRLPAVSIESKKDVIPFLISVINEIRSGRADVKKANALAYVGSTLLKAYELVEMEERIDKIETLVLERKTYK